MKVAVHPLSWTNEVIPEFGWDTPAEVYFADAKQAGYEGVEKGRNLPKDPATLRSMLDQQGLDFVTGWHSGYLADRSIEEEQDGIHDDATLLAEMGSKVIVYGECGSMAAGDSLEVPMTQRIGLGSLDVGKYADKLTELAMTVKKRYGLEFAYHHHLMMVVERPDEVNTLMENTGTEVGLLFDTGHCVAGGGNVSDLLARHGGRIRHFHLKDVRADVLDKVRNDKMSFNQAVRKGVFTVPGDGSIDFGPVTKYVSENGYDGWITVEAEQDPAVHPPLPTVTRARKFIRDQFGV